MLTSGAIADRIAHYLSDHMSDLQKSIDRGSQCTKHQLVVDKTIAGDSRRSTKLAMVWSDYRNTYDSISHFWILKCL